MDIHKETSSNTYHSNENTSQSLLCFGFASRFGSCLLLSSRFASFLDWGCLLLGLWFRSRLFALCFGLRLVCCFFTGLLACGLLFALGGGLFLAFASSLLGGLFLSLFGGLLLFGCSLLLLCCSLFLP